MGSWFKFKEVLSSNPGNAGDLGVLVNEFPPFALPEERKEFKPVLGRSGSMTVSEANNEGDKVFNDLILPVSCFVTDLSKVDQIATWLRGYGVLVLGDNPDRYYLANYTNQTDLRKILRTEEHRVFVAMFRCKPYRYFYPSPNPITVIDQGVLQVGSITNPGTVSAEPIYTITGSGPVELTIGDKSITIIDLSGSITIDMDLRLAYTTDSNPLVPQTSNIRKEDWPFTIKPGANAISFTGDITSAVINPRWRDI